MLSHFVYPLFSRYKSFYQWTDGSLAYYLKLKLGGTIRGGCAYYQPYDNNDRNIFFGSCYTKVQAQVLCEMPPLEKPEIPDVYIESKLGTYNFKLFTD